MIPFGCAPAEILRAEVKSSTCKGCRVAERFSLKAMGDLGCNTGLVPPWHGGPAFVRSSGPLPKVWAMMLPSWTAQVEVLQARAAREASELHSGWCNVGGPGLQASGMS